MAELIMSHKQKALEDFYKQPKEEVLECQTLEDFIQDVTDAEENLALLYKQVFPHIVLGWGGCFVTLVPPHHMHKLGPVVELVKTRKLAPTLTPQDLTDLFYIYASSALNEDLSTMFKMWIDDKIGLHENYETKGTA